MHWSFDVVSLDEVSERNARLAKDKKYQTLLDSGKHLWVEGSLRDGIVKLVN
jgi:hypothetical protein